MSKDRISFLSQLFFAFIIFLTTANLSLSQNDKDCQDLIRREFMSKIEGNKPTDLAPYYDAKNKKWGFIHRKNKEILVEAIFTNLQTFKPYLRDYSNAYGGCPLSLKYSSNEYSFFTPKEQFISPPMAVPTYDATKFVKNIDGFEVNENGEIEAVNAKFFTQKDSFSNLGYLKISKVFKYKDIYYGVARNENNGFCIYNDQGIIIDGFQNLKSFPNIGNSYDDNDLWILAKFDSEEYVFKSLTTQDTIKINCSSPSCWDCVGRNYFGYQILKVNDEIGLFDMITMKWEIKPDANNKFHSIYYSSNVEIENSESQKQVKQNRKISEIYLLTFENVIINLKGKSILPKQNNKEDH